MPLNKEPKINFQSKGDYARVCVYILYRDKDRPYKIQKGFTSDNFCE